MMVPEALVALIESSLRAAISAEVAPPSHAVAVSVIVHATDVGAPSSYSVNVQAHGPPVQLTLGAILSLIAKSRATMAAFGDREARSLSVTLEREEPLGVPKVSFDTVVISITAVMTLAASEPSWP